MLKEFELISGQFLTNMSDICSNLGKATCHQPRQSVDVSKRNIISFQNLVVLFLF